MLNQWTGNNHLKTLYVIAICLVPVYLPIRLLVLPSTHVSSLCFMLIGKTLFLNFKESILSFYRLIAIILKKNLFHFHFKRNKLTLFPFLPQ